MVRQTGCVKRFVYVDDNVRTPHAWVGGTVHERDEGFYADAEILLAIRGAIQTQCPKITALLGCQSGKFESSKRQ